MICTLTEKDGKPNWCECHQMYHPGHYAAYAVDPGPKGEKFRALWTSQNNGQNPLFESKKLLRSFPLALKCIHNQGKNGTTKVGCGECTTYACDIKGTVKVSYCVNCEHHEKPTDTVSNSWEPIRLDHTNLHPGVIPGLRFNSSIIESA